MARGKKSEYAERVQPFLEKISDWIANGATIEQICEQLNISKSAFYTYKSKNKDLADAFKKSRAILVDNLRGELARLAFKHTLVTTKTTTKYDEESGKEIIYEDRTVKEVDGDIAAIHLLLKNYDDEWYENRKTYELKKKELELKEKQIEKDEW